MGCAPSQAQHNTANSKQERSSDDTTQDKEHSTDSVVPPAEEGQQTQNGDTTGESKYQKSANKSAHRRSKDGIEAADESGTNTEKSDDVAPKPVELQRGDDHHASRQEKNDQTADNQNTVDNNETNPLAASRGGHNQQRDAGAAGEHEPINKDKRETEPVDTAPIRTPPRPPAIPADGDQQQQKQKQAIPDVVVAVPHSRGNEVHQDQSNVQQQQQPQHQNGTYAASQSPAKGGGAEPMSHQNAESGSSHSQPPAPPQPVPMTIKVIKGRVIHGFEVTQVIDSKGHAVLSCIQSRTKVDTIARWADRVKRSQPSKLQNPQLTARQEKKLPQALNASQLTSTSERSVSPSIASQHSTSFSTSSAHLNVAGGTGGLPLPPQSRAGSAVNTSVMPNCEESGSMRVVPSVCPSPMIDQQASFSTGGQTPNHPQPLQPPTSSPGQPQNLPFVPEQ